MSRQLAARPVAAPPDERRGPAGPPATGVVVSGVVAALLGLHAVLLLALVVGGGRPAPAAPGLPDAGTLTGWGLPVARLATDLAAVGAVGTLLFAAVLSPSSDGRLTAAGLRAARAASWWALGWAAAAAVGALLTVSSLYGVPVSALPPSSLVNFVTDIDSGRAAAGAVGLALLVALTARRSCRTAPAALLLVLGLGATVLPALLAGHSAAAANHALATGSLSVHVVSATLWVGGLLALVVQGRGTSSALAPAAARFSAIALACFVAAGASGLLNAWVLLGGTTESIGRAVGTGYGWLLLGKITALVTLGAFGSWHRRRTLPQLADGRPSAFRRFAAVEVAVMLATVALAVALSTAPPPPAAAVATISTPDSVAGSGPAAEAAQGAPPAPSQNMSGHDHGELSVGVFIDDERFHVSEPVSPEQAVTVFNESTTDVTITAHDGSFDAVVRGQTFITFTAPDAPGDYPFTSSHSPDFADVLVVE